MSQSSQELLIPEDLSEEDLLRAQLYHLLARFLSAAPKTETLVAGGQMSGDETPLGVAVQQFALACRQCNAATADDEYSDLFIGVGRGELLPYGSYYLTGFLNEKPLARLRDDMTALGVARRDDVTEPEDHVASILETMGGLIDGRFGAPLSLSHQKDFFDAHIASWMPVFFRDLEKASASVLYAALAAVARCFLDIEAQAFAFEGAKWPT